MKSGALGTIKKRVTGSISVKIASLVKNLSGVLVSKDYDKKGYADYLQKKYK